MHKLVYIPPPVIALTLIGLAFALEFWLLPGLPQYPLPVLGVLLMVPGILLAFSALFGFRREKTTFVPHGEPTTLVILGPYRWTRNPMYVGLLTALAGFAVFLGKPLLYAAPVALFLVLDRVFIPYEEAKLIRLFGESYREYLSQVRRWL